MADESDVEEGKQTIKDTAGKLGAAAKGALEGFREQSREVDLPGEAKKAGEWAKDTTQTVTQAAGKEVRKTADTVAEHKE